MQRNKQADSHSSVHVHTVVPVNVPVDADDSEMEDGGGAAHDVTGHPCIAQQIPQQPQTIVHLHRCINVYPSLRDFFYQIRSGLAGAQTGITDSGLVSSSHVLVPNAPKGGTAQPSEPSRSNYLTY